MPSALAPGHANSPGLVYGFLTDSSASLSVELPTTIARLITKAQELRNTNSSTIRMKCSMIGYLNFFSRRIVHIFPKISKYNISKA